MATAVTFTWPDDTDKHPALKLSVPDTGLAARDPDGTSLLSAKMRFVGSQDITLEATGPGEDEYMTPELVQFVVEYISSGSLAVTPGLEGSDCFR